MVGDNTACDHHLARFWGDRAQQGSFGSFTGLGSDVAGGVKKASPLPRRAAGAGFGWVFGGVCGQNTTHSTFLWSGSPPPCGGWVPTASMPPEPGGHRIIPVDLPTLDISFCAREARRATRYNIKVTLLKRNLVVLSFFLFPCSGMWTASQVRPGAGRWGQRGSQAAGGHGKGDSHPHSKGRGFSSTFLFCFLLF